MFAATVIALGRKAGDGLLSGKHYDISSNILVSLRPKPQGRSHAPDHALMMLCSGPYGKPVMLVAPFSPTTRMSCSR